MQKLLKKTKNTKSNFITKTNILAIFNLQILQKNWLRILWKKKRADGVAVQAVRLVWTVSGIYQNAKKNAILSQQTKKQFVNKKTVRLLKKKLY